MLKRKAVTQRSPSALVRGSHVSKTGEQTKWTDVWEQNTWCRQHSRQRWREKSKEMLRGRIWFIILESEKMGQFHSWNTFKAQVLEKVRNSLHALAYANLYRRERTRGGRVAGKWWRTPTPLMKLGHLNIHLLNILLPLTHAHPVSSSHLQLVPVIPIVSEVWLTWTLSNRTHTVWLFSLTKMRHAHVCRTKAEETEREELPDAHVSSL